jgi:hypothetical protein
MERIQLVSHEEVQNQTCTDVCSGGRLENMPTETGRTGGSGFLGSWCCKLLLDAALHCPLH